MILTATFYRMCAPLDVYIRHHNKCGTDTTAAAHNLTLATYSSACCRASCGFRRASFCVVARNHSLTLPAHTKPRRSLAATVLYLNIYACC